MTKLRKIFKVLLICHLVLSLRVSLVFPQIQSRIIGGTPTTISEAPFLVRLLHKEIFRCGGTLITSRFVVTAAHCVVDSQQVESFTIVAGVTYSYEEGVRSKIDKIVFPQDYHRLVIDMAVLQLHFSVRGSHIKPIGLCNTAWSAGDDVQVYGWGKGKQTAKNIFSQVRTATVPVFKKNLCAYLYRNIIGITNTMFCAFTPGHKNVCMGDSGGPAIINGQLCGVISFNNGCASHLYPGVYTDVSALREFIKTAVMRLSSNLKSNSI